LKSGKEHETLDIKSQISPVLRFLILAAAAGITLLTMQAVALIINSVILALVIAVCVAPLMPWLQRRGLSSKLSLLIAILVVLVGVVALVLFLGFSFARLLQALPTYQESLQERLVGVADWLETNLGITELPDWLDAEKVTAFVGDHLRDFLNSLYRVGFMLIIAIYMLWEASGLPSKVRRILSADHPLVGQFRTYSADMRDYVYISSQTGALTGLGDAIFLLILGVDFAILWGVLAAIMSFIPSIGFLLSLIPPTVLALVQFGWEKALLVLVGYVLINGAIEQLVKPRLIGQGLRLSPLAVFLALFVFGWTLGPVGGLLAVPLLLLLMIFVLEGSEGTPWMADMMRVDKPSEQSDLQTPAVPAQDG
jgi:predicted PurR-regulated permease PerM